MRDRTDRAYRLMSELGGISDRYLDEAQNYKPRRRSRIPVILAACIALSVLTVFGVLGAMNIAFGDKSDDAVRPEAQSLDGILCEAVSGGNVHKVSDSDLPIGDGEAYLVIRLNGQEGYYISDSLTVSQKAGIKSSIGYGDNVGDTSPALECSLWVILGDGSVISPYLKTAYGNIGTDMFDYSAEIYPTERFNAIVSEIFE